MNRAPCGLHPEHVAAIILAAGSASRFGAPKQLAEIEGFSLLERTLAQVKALECGKTLVVLHTDQPELRRQALKVPSVRVVTNTQVALGLSESLRLGLHAAQAADCRLEGVIVTLCDQPFLHRDVLRGLLHGLDLGYEISACRYQGILGVPAAFRRGVFHELEALVGDMGARYVIRRDPARVYAQDFPEGAFDVDRPEDLERLRGLAHASHGVP